MRCNLKFLLFLPLVQQNGEHINIANKKIYFSFCNDSIMKSRKVDFPVVTAVGDRASNNSNVAKEVRDIRIYIDLDVYSNIIGFSEFLETLSKEESWNICTINSLTNLGNNWGGILQSLGVKLIDSKDSNQGEQT